MRTILFIFFLLLLWCGFSSFESTSVRPNGWYYVIDMEHDSLSADPIVTVKDFARIKLDSVSDSNEDNMAYRILGVLDDSHKTTWAEDGIVNRQAYRILIQWCHSYSSLCEL